MYTDTCPCLTCAVKILQVGIEEVVYAGGYNMDRETARVLEEGGVRLRQFSGERAVGEVGIEVGEGQGEGEGDLDWIGKGLEDARALVKRMKG